MEVVILSRGGLLPQGGDKMVGDCSQVEVEGISQKGCLCLACFPSLFLMCKRWPDSITLSPRDYFPPPSSDLSSHAVLDNV